jgi:hypothetical protein
MYDNPPDRIIDAQRNCVRRPVTDDFQVEHVGTEGAPVVHGGRREADVTQVPDHGCLLEWSLQ